MSNANGAVTIAVQIPLNVALLGYQSQIALERWEMNVEDFTTEEMITAWTKAVQLHLEHLAEDTDFFLARNANEDVFLDALAVS
jgi:hypothetical protein